MLTSHVIDGFKKIKFNLVICDVYHQNKHFKWTKVSKSGSSFMRCNIIMEPDLENKTITQCWSGLEICMLKFIRILNRQGQIRPEKRVVHNEVTEVDCSQASFL